MPKNELPNVLIENIQAGNCVLFLGAGISASEGGIPSGSQLSKELSERSNYHESDMTLAKIAQFYEMTHDRQSLIEHICNRMDNLQYKPLAVHNRIADMPFRTIITTNYDTLLENALRMAGKESRVMVNDNDIVYTDDSKISIIKMHGDVHHRDSIVITEDDYLDYFIKRPSIAEMISHVAASRTLLFLGYGLNDSTFNYLSTRVSQNLGRFKRKAYAVQRQPSQYAKLYWEKKGISILDSDADEFLKEVQALISREEPKHQLEEKAIIKAVDELTGDVIHRLTSPIAAIRAWTLLLEEEIVKPNADPSRMVNFIKSSTEKALSLINNLKQSYYEVNLQPIDVSLSVSNMLETIKIPETVKFSINIEKELPPVLMGANQLSSALRVLVENAIEAMQSEGNITIKAYQEKIDMKNLIKIEVSDTGTGIPKQQREFLFEFGISTKEQGRGFGLWWLKNMIERLGGSITISSTHNTGAVFTILLPIADKSKLEYQKG